VHAWCLRRCPFTTPAHCDDTHNVAYICPTCTLVQVSLVGGFVKGGGDTDFKATMIGFDENKDIAVLKIEVPDKKVGAAAGPTNQHQPVILHTCCTIDKVDSVYNEHIM
jgi:hypothetical protein